MSRIGKKQILIPKGVEIKIEGQRVVIKGSRGELQREVRPEIGIEVKDDKIFVLPKVLAAGKKIKGRLKKINAFWGLTRVLLANMVKGVSEGFEKKLEIQGIGFRAILEGEDLLLYVGFSHPVKIKIPKNIKVAIEKNIISVSGADKELVGQFAANLRKTKPPEPYKGKGIRYLGERVLRKVGKRVVTAGG